MEGFCPVPLGRVILLLAIQIIAGSLSINATLPWLPECQLGVERPAHCITVSPCQLTVSSLTAFLIGGIMGLQGIMGL